MQKSYSITILILSLFWCNLSAQNETQRFHVGVDAGYNYSTDTENNSAYISRTTTGLFSPEFAYYLSERFCLGTSVSYSFRKVKDVLDDDLAASMTSESQSVLGRWHTLEDSSSLLNRGIILYEIPNETVITSEFSLAIFGKYHWSVSEKLDFALLLSFGPGIKRFPYNQIDTDGNLTKQITNRFFFTSSCRPEVNYSLTENIVISLILPGLLVYYEGNNEPYESTYNAIGLSNHLSNLNLGVFYRF